MWACARLAAELREELTQRAQRKNAGRGEFSSDLKQQQSWVLVGGGIWGNEFGEAEDGVAIVRFAVNFVDAFPGWLFARRRLGSGHGYLHFKAVQGTAQDHAALQFRRMTMETTLAGRDNRSLKLQNGFIAQAGGVGEITSSPADSSDQTVVRVNAQDYLMGKAGHG